MRGKIGNQKQTKECLTTQEKNQERWCHGSQKKEEVIGYVEGC